MRRADETPPAVVPVAEPWSKTRRKAEMETLRKLGEALLGLDSAKLGRLSLPERLAEAIADAQHITKRGARRRHLHYIGRLMRELEPETIAALKLLLAERR